MIKDELFSVINFHTASDNKAEWNIKEIYETVRTIWMPEESLMSKLQEMVKWKYWKE